MAKAKTAGEVVNTKTDLITSKTVKTSYCGPVACKGITLRWMKAIIAEVQDRELVIPPPLLTPDFLDQNTDSAEEKIRLLTENTTRRTVEILKWIFASPELAPIAVTGCTDLVDEDRILDLSLHDLLQICLAFIECSNVPASVELLVGFFQELGDHMGALETAMGALGAAAKTATE